MATIVVSNPNFTTSVSSSAQINRADNSVIQLSDPPSGLTETLTGSFSYAADGSLNGGVVNGVDIAMGGQEAIQITGLNVSAVTAYNMAVNGDASGIANLMFGASDQATGSAYAEALHLMGGDDTVAGMDGSDTVFGEVGNDFLNGNVGADVVLGNQGADQLYGGKDNDTLYGGQGGDTLHGDLGNDVISGDLWNDVLYGGAGADRFVFARGGGQDQVMDFNGAEGDRVQLAAGTQYSVVADASGAATIDLGNGDQMHLVGVAVASFDAGWVVFG